MLTVNQLNNYTFFLITAKCNAAVEVSQFLQEAFVQCFSANRNASCSTINKSRIKCVKATKSKKHKEIRKETAFSSGYTP